jgi:hypothetical protein
LCHEFVIQRPLEDGRANWPGRRRTGKLHVHSPFTNEDV